MIRCSVHQSWLRICFPSCMYPPSTAVMTSEHGFVGTSLCQQHPMAPSRSTVFVQRGEQSFAVASPVICSLLLCVTQRACPSYGTNLSLLKNRVIILVQGPTNWVQQREVLAGVEEGVWICLAPVSPHFAMALLGRKCLSSGPWAEALAHLMCLHPQSKLWEPGEPAGTWLC